MKFVTVFRMENIDVDALVIGAGAAGLAAALDLAGSGKTVAVIEAKEMAGGRIKTVEENGYPVELGAEFVHGNLPLTKALLKEAGANIYATGGRIWQYRNGQLQEQDDFIEDFDVLEQTCSRLEKDKTVAGFLQSDLAGDHYKDLRYSLQNYVEGYYAADTARASTLALCEELIHGDEEQYRIMEGYGPLVRLLEKKCREAGVLFFFSQPVKQLHWEKNTVTVITEKETFTGKKALITVSIGVLQQEGISFFPALPQVKAAALALGFGHVQKLVFRFNRPFWKEKEGGPKEDLSDLGFLFSSEEMPTWWTHFPKTEALLTGWLGGPQAAEWQFLPGGEIMKKALSSLSRIFDTTEESLDQQLEKSWHYNWSADPFFGGAYSYEVVGGAERIAELLQPVEETLFFAGEGLHNGKDIGTVEAALHSGKGAAKRMLKLFAT